MTHDVTVALAALGVLGQVCGGVAAGRRQEADEQLHRALSFYRTVDASRSVRQGETLLAATA